MEIFLKCGKENHFGRTVVEEITGLKSSGVSKLIKLLIDNEVVEPVAGHLITGDGRTNVMHLNTLDYDRWDELIKEV